MPTAPGLRPYVDEQRRYVSITLDERLWHAIKALASAMDTSMASVKLYCTTLGVNPLMRAMGRPELELPAYLHRLVQAEAVLDQLMTEPEGLLPGLEVVSSEATATAGESNASRTQATVGFVVSQEALFAAVAKELRMGKQLLATWAVVQHVNVLLAKAGVAPVTLPQTILDRLPSIVREVSGLDPLPAAQEALEIPTSRRGRKEARLAS